MKLRQLKPAQRRRKTKSKGTRLSLWKRIHGKCWYCGKQVGKKEFRLDHQEPFSRGGADSKRNLVVSCGDCDKSKGAKTLHEFRATFPLGDATVFYGERARVRK